MINFAYYNFSNSISKPVSLALSMYVLRTLSFGMYANRVRTIPSALRRKRMHTP